MPSFLLYVHASCWMLDLAASQECSHTFSLLLLVIDALEKMRSALEMVGLILVGVDGDEGWTGNAVSAAVSVE